MSSFFKKERLLLSLIVVFGIFFGIFGTILKHTAYANQNIEAPGIAFGFLAMHDGILTGDSTPVSMQQPPAAPEPDPEPIPEPEPDPDTTPDPAPAPEPEPEPEAVFQTVHESYFSDALFIGDSRTDGLRLYAPFDGADYFCNTGMSVLKCLDTSVESVEGVGSVTLDQLLDQRDYGKVYISLGINDVGYDHEYLVDYYEKIYNLVREKEPKALIYIMSSMHVAKGRAINEPMFESENVDHLNELFGALADGVHSFYIDVNEAFDDEEGYLVSDYTGDNVHLYAKYYEMWDEWLCQNAVVVPGMANPGTEPEPEPELEPESEPSEDEETLET